ncbi:MAG: glutathione S-transferase family protein [Gammaproteobacteria bacterium]|nr:glutathione S-transferase family protein [Gammaproteobacteria bacterium]MYH47073.1 glutathione S-transferase family protein [Gammaproteobacteria bacterium]MYL14431.1 glutathione S-transferase family protein [Gammaproteobacteria bacterium]
MIKLYGFQQSRSFRALWALEESGLEYEYVQVKLRTDAEIPDSAKNPKYLTVNVQGKVPTLIDGDLTLTESVAILYYIARAAPESGLLPNASMDVYARIDELACFVLAELEQPLWSKGKHMFALPEEHRIPRMLETANFEFDKALGALEHLLDDGEYAIGDSFSLVDILLAQTFNWAIRFEFDLPQKYVDFRNRLYDRPACRRALEVMKGGQ